MWRLEKVGSNILTHVFSNALTMAFSWNIDYVTSECLLAENLEKLGMFVLSKEAEPSIGYFFYWFISSEKLLSLPSAQFFSLKIFHAYFRNSIFEIFCCCQSKFLTNVDFNPPKNMKLFSKILYRNFQQLPRTWYVYFIFYVLCYLLFLF